MINILVVDDSLTIRVKFKDYLSEHGFEVHEASNGMEALEILKRNSDIKLIISDLNMPIMDGMTFIEFVRKEETGKEVPIMIYSTELDKSLVERITDPLTHLVRNSLDHGVEMPDEREALGKPRTGKLVLSARHQGGNILIEVRDDGAGMGERIHAARGQRRHAVHELWVDASLLRHGQILATQGLECNGEPAGGGAGDQGDLAFQIEELAHTECPPDDS